MPEYPVRSIREAWYRARLGNCYSATSNYNYLASLKGFGGHVEVNPGDAAAQPPVAPSTTRHPGANYFALMDVEKLCGGADYTATTTTTVVLSTGATADDVIEIIVYDVFAVANLIKKDGDTVEGVINFNGKEITLDADFDTSITSDTDDQIDFKIGGSDIVTITSTGVGIGTTSPGQKLTVICDASFISNSNSRVLYLKQQSADNGNIIQFQNQSGTDIWELVGRNNGFYLYLSLIHI